MSRKTPSRTRVNLYPLAVQHYQAGRLAEARAVVEEHLRVDSRSFAGWNLKAVLASITGDPATSELAYRKAVAIRPDYVEAWNNLGALLCGLQRFEDAETAHRRALALRPDYAEAWYNLGIVLGVQQRLPDAEAAYRRAVALKPGYAGAWCNLANVLNEQHNLPEAELAYRQAVAVQPDHAEGWYNLGMFLGERQKFSEAETAYQRALALRPDYAEVWSNLGNLLRECDRPAEAEVAYQRSIGLRPGYAEAWHNLAVFLQTQQRYAEAETAYRQALTIRPDYADAWNHLGVLLQATDRLAEAETAFGRALTLQPASAGAWNNLGILLQAQQRFAEAESAYRRAVAIQPDYAHAVSMAAHCAQHLCDWQQLETDAARLLSASRQQFAGMSPCVLLAREEMAPEQHRQASYAWALEKCRNLLHRPPMVDPSHHPVHHRLRIAYLSADFHDHPVLYHLGEVLTLHDRTKVEIHAYSCGPETGDTLRERAKAACEYFHDMRASSDAVVAQHMVDTGIDILVDLSGYTANTRLGVAARRPAPVIVSWLGYPGTLGHPRLADYLIGDPVGTPLEHAHHFSETLALMPHCAGPHDNSSVIGPAGTRQAAGLPERGIVFCCFNKSYKFTRPVFAIWCRLLGEVPGSVLWLHQTNAVATRNLRDAAASHGVDPSRLVFAPPVSHELHRGRLQLADLALDTFPYGFGATGFNALWSGVPVITRMGTTTVSRMAASQLHAIGLPELVTTTPEEYFNLALALAHDPQRLADLRQRLAANRLTMPLFDTVRFTHDLERLYQTMWEQHGRGVREAIVMTHDA